ncbi:MAG: bifunctional folylpolyglutamate synthase/dihydrofolate synthase [Bacteroidales bacterium]|nr:bifunctional folylpolyglutamate synthase/dihydrofolate synthase [Bacteroidales bacterium]
MTYQDALDFMYSQLPMFHRIGKEAYKNNLDNTLALDDYLNHPHQQFKTIHVAGTNGKGSVSHFLASIFQTAGYKTGLYTSPHLVDFRERIRVNGHKIPKEAVVQFLEDHSSFIQHIKPSFFEMSVALAFDFFRKEAVEIAIIEVGMGGRLDSTNIISPELSIITNISLDHTQFLGVSLEEIAGEKAGIIKPHTPVVIGEYHPQTEKVFLEKAKLKQSPIQFASETWQTVLIKTGIFSYQYQIQGENGIMMEGISELGGSYQEKNLSTVFQAYNLLKTKFNLKSEHFIEGIQYVKRNTGFMGRWEIIQESPTVLCDTGHNEAGLQAVLAQIKSLSFEKLHIIFGMVNDKDVFHILQLLPEKANYYFVKSSVPRSLNSFELADFASKLGLQGSCFETVLAGYHSAIKQAKPNDLIYIGGSTFVVADFLSEYLREE